MRCPIRYGLGVRVNGWLGIVEFGIQEIKIQDIDSGEQNGNFPSFILFNLRRECRFSQSRSWSACDEVTLG